MSDTGSTDLLPEDREHDVGNNPKVIGNDPLGKHDNDKENDASSNFDEAALDFDEASLMLLLLFNCCCCFAVHVVRP
jgi:hypothetical protein